MTVNQRIRNGIALLDAKGPRNWRRKVAAAIRAKRFDISSPKHCVLGEIYGDYEIGLNMLEMTNDGSQYGFLEDYSTYTHSNRHGFEGSDHDLLTQEWKRLYRKGKAAAKKTKRQS